MNHYATSIAAARMFAPELPTFCYRKDRLNAAARWFIENYPATPFYAVKANPAPHILRDLWAAGIRDFDVASEVEARLVAETLPGARMAFLHPVKSRRAIAAAYELGCRIFVLDTEAELDKILETVPASDELTLLVRIHVSNEGATLPLAGKFGANEADAPDLLRKARAHASRLGVSFHVGSQAMNPGAWATAMADVSRIITQAAVTVDIADVGGGFPGIYADTPPPSLEIYADIVRRAFEDMMVLESAELWCEPGRALVTEAESLLTRVELVKGDAIYLNDGSYGALYDAVHERWAFPVRAISGDGRDLGEAIPYTVYGPTCDSADVLPEPLWLPAGLAEGDYIEFGNIGAYGRAMAGRFNGFGVTETVSVSDTHFATLYGAGSAPAKTLGGTSTA